MHTNPPLTETYFTITTLQYPAKLNTYILKFIWNNHSITTFYLLKHAAMTLYGHDRSLHRTQSSHHHHPQSRETAWRWCLPQTQFQQTSPWGSLCNSPGSWLQLGTVLWASAGCDTAPSSACLHLNTCGGVLSLKWRRTTTWKLLMLHKTYPYVHMC